MEFFDELYNYYYLVLILQGLCVFHSMRKGTQSKWLWVIVFLPVIGSIAYIFTEIIQKRDVENIQYNVATMIYPAGKIKSLEKNFKFSNTFTNRIALADAYFANAEFEKAIQLYEPALSGVFDDNAHVIKNLIQCYVKFERYDDILRLAPKISNVIDFSKSPANLAYCIALEKNGNLIEAEKEYKKMNHRFSNYEARYYYGDFLLRNNKKEDAALIFHEVIDEAQQLSRREKGNSKSWIDKSEKAWQKIMSEMSATL